MTDHELKVIEARLAAATPGEWIEEENDWGVYIGPEMPIAYVERRVEDAVFIAHAPNDIRRLVDEIKRLRKDNEELQKLVDKFSEANRRLRIAVTNREEGKFYENPRMGR